MCSSQPLLRAGELLLRQAALLELLAGQGEVAAGGTDAGVAQDLRGQRQAGPRLDEPCPCGAPQGMEGLAVTGRVIDAGRVRRRRMRVEPVEFPSFTNGALSRTNTSGASQSGRPCKIHSATALPASADSGSTSGLDVLAWTSRISSRRQSISSRRSATMSQHRSPVETASKTIA